MGRLEKPRLGNFLASLLAKHDETCPAKWNDTAMILHAKVSTNLLQIRPALFGCCLQAYLRSWSIKKSLSDFLHRYSIQFGHKSALLTKLGMFKHFVAI